MDRRMTVLVAVAVALTGLGVGVGVAVVDDGTTTDETSADACLTTPPLVAVAGNPPDRGPGSAEVTVIRPDGSRSVVTPPDWVATGPDVSPDGRRLALVRAVGDYESAGPGAEHLWTMGIGGSDPRQLTEGAVSDRDPAWSPDGHTIAFVRSDAARTSILTVPADGGSPTEVVVGEGAPGGPAIVLRAPEWSPTGDRLVYVRQQVGPTGGTTGTELWSIGADGSGATRRAERIDPSATTLDWHPDGTRVLVSSNQGGMRAVDLATGIGTTLGTDTGFARWSRRGTHVVHLAATSRSQETPVALVETPVTGVEGAPLGEARDLGHTDGFPYPYFSVSVAPCSP
jgi:dipeptidyl aminopeptidase/acylaminoacyl peptidase